MPSGAGRVSCVVARPWGGAGVVGAAGPGTPSVRRVWPWPCRTHLLNTVNIYVACAYFKNDPPARRHRDLSASLLLTFLERHVMLRSSSRMGLIPLAILALGACEVELHCLGQPGGVRRLECHATAGARGRDSLLPRLTLTRPPPGTPVLFGDTVQRRVDVQASAGPGEPTEASLATGGARLLDAHRRASCSRSLEKLPRLLLANE